MIPLSKENLTVDVFAGVIPNGEILVKIYCKDSEIGLEQQEEILQGIQKTKLFDSLLVENQTILDTISQVKIANEMFDRENKELNERLQKDHMIIAHANTQIVKLTEVKQEQDNLLNKQNLALEKLVPEAKDLQDEIKHFKERLGESY